MFDNMTRPITAWSADLGALAGNLPRNQPAIAQVHHDPTSADLYSRVTAILRSLRQGRAYQSAEKLKANHFIMGD